MPNQHIITIKEARKVLGAKSQKLSDTQVQEIIASLTLMARKYFTNSSSKK